MAARAIAGRRRPDDSLVDDSIKTKRLDFVPAAVVGCCSNPARRRSPRARTGAFVGQDGKDVVYVPTPPEMVERMLDLAGVTPQDYVIDLGSGDGRIVMAAATSRGAGARHRIRRGRSSRSPGGDRRTGGRRQSGVRPGRSVRKRFLGGDGPDDVPALGHHGEAAATIFDLKPGTRVVSNSFTMDDWPPDETDSSTAARRGARFTCGSCRRRSRGPGVFRRAT